MPVGSSAILHPAKAEPDFTEHHYRMQTGVDQFQAHIVKLLNTHTGLPIAHSKPSESSKLEAYHI